MWLDLPEQREISPRIKALLFLAVMLISVLAVRLWFLQVALGSDLRANSLNNSIRWDRRIPPRGSLSDRYGRVIASVHLQEVVYLSPADAKKFPETVNETAAILNITPGEIEDILKASQSGKYKPVPIAVGPTPIQLTELLEKNKQLSGISIIEQPIRIYSGGKIWAHAIGYVGPITEKELSQSKVDEHSPSDYVGKIGVEKAQEDKLQGTAGGEKYEVDSKGRRTRLLGSTNPTPGDRLILTFDARLQNIALTALEGRRGAVVALVPKTGEVLALVSSPSYDPNVFVHKLSSKTYSTLLNDEEKPLYNRAIQTTLSPGSTFKIVTSIAGMLNGDITPDSNAYCPGYIYLGKKRVNCHQIHGAVDFNRAISQSCDVFFYDKGMKIGPDKLSSASMLCGLGAKTGIDVPQERHGLVPTTEWKKRIVKEPWRIGDTINMSIGQGFLTTTPLQMACVAALVANKGIIYKPQTVQRTYNGSILISRLKPEPTHKVNLSQSNWNAIIQAMHDATTRGTAKSVRVSGIEIASKTGSAEEKKGKLTNAWYIGFAPLKNPKIAICVLIQQAGHGGEVAAPIARQMFESYLKNQNK